MQKKLLNQNQGRAKDISLRSLITSLFYTVQQATIGVRANF